MGKVLVAAVGCELLSWTVFAGTYGQRLLAHMRDQGAFHRITFCPRSSKAALNEQSDQTCSLVGQCLFVKV